MAAQQDRVVVAVVRSVNADNFLLLMKLSIIIPVLNEAEVLETSLNKLQWVRRLGHEIIVVDGGSRDQSMMLAVPLVDHVVSSMPGRALQMNAGAKSASGNLFLFLHIDTFLPDNAIDALSKIFSDRFNGWGRFDVRLSGQHASFRIIEYMMNWRSRLTSIATGDQAIFISRGLFESLNGYTVMPLMEDIEMSSQLRKMSKPFCLREKVVTSSRRWEKRGIYTTVWLMWRLRLAYWLGSEPARLAQQYR